MTRTITTADQLADALDAATGGVTTAGDLVSWAYANGAACGVGISYETDDDYGRQLTSTDGRWVVRYSEQDGFWTAVTVQED